MLRNSLTPLGLALLPSLTIAASGARALQNGNGDREICPRIDKLLPELLLWGRGWRDYRAGMGDPAL